MRSDRLDEQTVYGGVRGTSESAMPPKRPPHIMRVAIQKPTDGRRRSFEILLPEHRLEEVVHVPKVVVCRPHSAREELKSHALLKPPCIRLNADHFRFIPESLLLVGLHTMEDALFDAQQGLQLGEEGGKVLQGNRRMPVRQSPAKVGWHSHAAYLVEPLILQVAPSVSLMESFPTQIPYRCRL